MYTTKEKHLLLAGVVWIGAMAITASTLPPRYMLAPVVMAAMLAYLVRHPLRARRGGRHGGRPTMDYEIIVEEI